MKTISKIIILFTIVLWVACQREASTNSDKSTRREMIPLSEREGMIDPIVEASGATATPGGAVNLWGGPAPKNLNFWINPSSAAATISGLLFEPLAVLHSKENQPVGVLAKSWKMSADSMQITFELNPLARWSDGKAITAEDIQFYYDVIMNKQNLTAVFRVSLSRFERPIIVDERTIIFKAKEKHWQNFWAAAECVAFPKHLWADKKFNNIKWDFEVVSGPYRISKVSKNRSVTLKRRLNWWGDRLAYNFGKYNFDKIKYKYIQDRVKTLEAFKKGDLDIYPIYTASIWMKQTQFESVEKGLVNRERIYNKRPIGAQGFAMNMRKEKFKDLRVREALTLLLDRDIINEKFMYKQYFMLNSYFPDLYPQNQNPNHPVEVFNSAKARELLKSAGYEVNSMGRLEKDGKIFSISFLTAQEDMRHLEVYTSALKAVGVDAKIEKSNNPTVMKRLEKFDYEMYWMAWGAGRLRDPESKWHSKTADEINSINYPGFAHPLVDSLIEISKTEYDLDKRNMYLKEMDQIILKERPFALLWNNDHHRLLSWNKYSRPSLPLGLYGGPDDVVSYWWLDRTKEKLLESARVSGEKIQSYKSHTYWDK